MQVTITADQDAKQLTITVTDVNWDKFQGGSFYQGEQQVHHLLTVVGHALIQQLLASRVRRPARLHHAGQQGYRKADSLGHDLTLYGPVASRALPIRAAVGARPSARWRPTVSSPLERRRRSWPKLSASS